MWYLGGTFPFALIAFDHFQHRHDVIIWRNIYSYFRIVWMIFTMLFLKKNMDQWWIKQVHDEGPGRNKKAFCDKQHKYQDKNKSYFSRELIDFNKQMSMRVQMCMLGSSAFLSSYFTILSLKSTQLCSLSCCLNNSVLLTVCSCCALHG